MLIYKERAGVISKDPVWVCMDSQGYLYIEDTLFALIKTLITEWRHDKHLVG